MDLQSLLTAIAALVSAVSGTAPAALTEPVPISSPAYEAAALARSDDRTNSRYRDQYILSGRAGDQLDIEVAGEDFELTTAIEGPGLRQSSTPKWSGAALLEVTLPGDGAYIVTVTSIDANKTGEYTLTVVASCKPPAYLNAVGSCVRP